MINLEYLVAQISASFSQGNGTIWTVLVNFYITLLEVHVISCVLSRGLIWVL